MHNSWVHCKTNQLIDTPQSLHYIVPMPNKVKVWVLHPVQQPGSYWDRSSALPLVGGEPTQR